MSEAYHSDKGGRNPSTPKTPRPAPPKGSGGSQRPRITSVMIFDNGMVAAFNEHGDQVPRLQEKSVVDLWVAQAIEEGCDINGCDILVGNGKYRVSVDEKGVPRIDFISPQKL